MFFRVKSAGSYQYLQIVHSFREGEKVRQQVFGTLGRLDALKASGRLEALMRSGLRHCENFAVIDAHGAGETEPVTVLRIGPDLVFGRLWKETILVQFPWEINRPSEVQSSRFTRHSATLRPLKVEAGINGLLPTPWVPFHL